MTSTLPPGGWYGDPYGQPCLRWWDGTQWTVHTNPLPMPQAIQPALQQELTVAHDEPGPLPWTTTAGGGSHTVPAIPRPVTTTTALAASATADRTASADDKIRIGSSARAVRGAAQLLLANVSGLRTETETRKSRVREDLVGVRRDLAIEHLKTIPVERLNEATEGRLRVGALRKSGYRTVADVVTVSPLQLKAIPGVGELTATQIVAAARHLVRATEETMPIRLDADRRPAAHTQLIAGIRAFDDAERLCGPIRNELEFVRNTLQPLIQASSPTRSRLRWLFASRSRREAAMDALRELDRTLRAPTTCTLEQNVDNALAQLTARRPDDSALWSDYAARAPEYYGILGEVADLALDVAASHGYLPAALAEQIAEQQLDTSWLNVSLRGYQAFGARFALVQRRSILGDEMGLGKTIEAIAYLGHLAALGATHFIVVCPASVLVNWTRELTNRSKLRAYRLHGNERSLTYHAWHRNGGVAVTTFDTLRHFPPTQDTKVAAVVVDEAHFVKNPQAMRSRNVRAWTDVTKHVLYLTGTPMENRVDEFRSLVHNLQPTVAKTLGNVNGLAGAAQFRSAVAPVYLRRNQEDVLSELPERLDVDDWVELSSYDNACYRDALISRNFMAMRRAPLLSGPEKSAKLQRLTEIIEESAANGWKVVIFSYFHDVLTVAQEALGGVAFGPLTGSVAPSARQELIDRFSAAPGHAVLVSQIQAGGTGLNMQAASVVVLTEPQWKPSMEEQAIARCHRMGQVRRVHVHRLLAQDSADQRMLEILSGKRALFDEYVRRSALKDVAAEAVDVADTAAAAQAVSFAKAEQEIIEHERTRLGIGERA